MWNKWNKYEQKELSRARLGNDGEKPLPTHAKPGMLFKEPSKDSW